MDGFHVGIGCLYLVLPLPFLVIYAFILKVLLSDSILRQQTAYRFILLLSFFDCMELIAHLSSGIGTLAPGIWVPAVAKIFGVLATPCYVGYVVTTLVLSTSRLTRMVFPRRDSIVFGEQRDFFWIGGVLTVVGAFALALASPWASICYEVFEVFNHAVFQPDFLSWSYDYDLDWSTTVQKIEMYIEEVSIAIAGLFHLIIVVALCKHGKEMNAVQGVKTKHERPLLIQTAIITSYCLVMNFCWHNVHLIFDTESLLAAVLLNLAWLLNSSIYPLIHLVMNQTIRQRALGRLGSNVGPPSRVGTPPARSIARVTTNTAVSAPTSRHPSKGSLVFVQGHL